MDDGKNADNNHVDNDIELPDVEVVVDSAVMEKEDRFSIKVEEGSSELSFGTPWKTNESNGYEIAIEGRGPEGIEEGMGFVVLKDKNGDVKSLLLGDGGENFSPKYVEWVDDNNFLMYVVNTNGRVFAGGTLYMVNIESMELVVLYNAKENEEITEASKINADTINIKMLVDKEGENIPSEKNIKVK